MRFASIGSGSEGNGLVVEAGATRILIDCGFGLRDAAMRLERIGIAPETLDAILVTHEHADHLCGVPGFAARHGIPVWLTFGTLAVAGDRFLENERVHGFDSHYAFAIGDIEVRPFPVPHDAREPVQFVLSDGAFRVGIVTDLGTSTPHVEANLTGCDALVLECNHDVALLAASDYPLSLKARVAGRFGHLDNDRAGILLAALDTARLQHVVAAHLSRQNNTPERARAALASALGCAAEWIGIADQTDGFAWRALC